MSGADAPSQALRPAGLEEREAGMRIGRARGRRIKNLGHDGLAGEPRADAGAEAPGDGPPPAPARAVDVEHGPPVGTGREESEGEADVVSSTYLAAPEVVAAAAQAMADQHKAH